MTSCCLVAGGLGMFIVDEALLLSFCASAVASSRSEAPSERSEQRAMSWQFIAMSLSVREDWTIQRASFQRLLGSSTRIHHRFFLCAARVFRGEIRSEEHTS